MSEVYRVEVRGDPGRRGGVVSAVAYRAELSSFHGRRCTGTYATAREAWAHAGCGGECRCGGGRVIAVGSREALIVAGAWEEDIAGYLTGDLVLGEYGEIRCEEVES